MALWIISCSEKKVPAEQAAGIKYDSRQHRAILAAFYQERFAAGDELLILSAEFGLVEVYRPLPDYERKMDEARAKELAADPAQQATLDAALAGQDEVFIFGGKVYRDMVKAMLPEDVSVEELVGADRGCGDHFSALVEALKTKEAQ